MVFKRMLAAFGVGGPSVDTVLESAEAMPGQVLTGEVRIQGGSADADIDRIELSLVTRAEAEYGSGEAQGAAVPACHGRRAGAGECEPAS